MRRTIASRALLLTLVVAPPAGAQLPVSKRVTDVAINAAIGGIIAAARSAIGGHAVQRAMFLGAAGGGIESVGRQIAAQRFTAAALVGREVGAAGISLGYSSGADSLVLLAPIGPLTLEIRPRDSSRVHARLDLFDAASIITAVADGHSTFDLSASLAHGAAVFRRPRSRMPLGYDESGFTQVGTIFVASDVSPAERALALRHESVHLLQWDTYQQLVTLPIERAAIARIPGGSTLSRFADLGVLAPLSVYVIAKQIPYDRQPWEREAYELTTGRPVRGAP